MMLGFIKEAANLECDGDVLVDREVVAPVGELQKRAAAGVGRAVRGGHCRVVFIAVQC